MFSKLDAKVGHWSVCLEENSQLLTTFRIPFGCYCFQKLAFGLNISQDVFQQRMDEILEGLQGCVRMADDVCAFGSTEEHDRNLLALMEAAKVHSLVFNSDKCSIKCESISFFGNIHSVEGIITRPYQGQAIHEMPTPQEKDDLRHFLGLMTYMGTIIPNLSDLPAILRDLLKKDISFHPR